MDKNISKKLDELLKNKKTLQKGQFFMVTKDVADTIKKGLLRKHPGHVDQSVHGRKRGSKKPLEYKDIPRLEGRLGRHQQNALDFVRKYPGEWHSYAKDKLTNGAIEGLKQRGLIETTKFGQFRLKEKKVTKRGNVIPTARLGRTTKEVQKPIGYRTLPGRDKTKVTKLTIRQAKELHGSVRAGWGQRSIPGGVRPVYVPKPGRSPGPRERTVKRGSVKPKGNKIRKPMMSIGHRIPLTHRPGIETTGSRIPGVTSPKPESKRKPKAGGLRERIRNLGRRLQGRPVGVKPKPKEGTSQQRAGRLAGLRFARETGRDPAEQRAIGRGSKGIIYREQARRGGFGSGQNRPTQRTLQNAAGLNKTERLAKHPGHADQSVHGRRKVYAGAAAAGAAGAVAGRGIGRVGAAVAPAVRGLAVTAAASRAISNVLERASRINPIGTKKFKRMKGKALRAIRRHKVKLGRKLAPAAKAGLKLASRVKVPGAIGLGLMAAAATYGLVRRGRSQKMAKHGTHDQSSHGKESRGGRRWDSTEPIPRPPKLPKEYQTPKPNTRESYERELDTVEGIIRRHHEAKDREGSWHRVTQERLGELQRARVRINRNLSDIKQKKVTKAGNLTSGDHVLVLSGDEAIVGVYAGNGKVRVLTQDSYVDTKPPMKDVLLIERGSTVPDDNTSPDEMVSLVDTLNQERQIMEQLSEKVKRGKVSKRSVDKHAQGTHDQKTHGRNKAAQTVRDVRAGARRIGQRVESGIRGAGAKLQEGATTTRQIADDLDSLLQGLEAGTRIYDKIKSLRDSITSGSEKMTKQIGRRGRRKIPRPGILADPTVYRGMPKHPRAVAAVRSGTREMARHGVFGTGGRKDPVGSRFGPLRLPRSQQGAGQRRPKHLKRVQKNIITAIEDTQKAVDAALSKGISHSLSTLADATKLIRAQKPNEKISGESDRKLGELIDELGGMISYLKDVKKKGQFEKNQNTKNHKEGSK